MAGGDLEVLSSARLRNDDAHNFTACREPRGRNLVSDRMNSVAPVLSVPEVRPPEIRPPEVRPLLIVDDDTGLLRQLRWAFSEHKVHAASNRQEAVALIRAQRVPVAILDLGLPPDPDGASEGLATLSEIREVSPGTKVIVATGNETREHASARDCARSL